jgi:AraC-like DNA-binding protein
MNSSKAFDDVILYLEKTIFDGCEIDYNEISKIAMSPAALFQRIFIFVSGISISDYVRKRRLTLAGHELKNNDISVLDAAMKYGFQSHSSFTRAFKEHHGITPSEAKVKSTKLNDYLPINFSEMRFIGGKRIMAEMKKM